jgi:hypothetical protein
LYFVPKDEKSYENQKVPSSFGLLASAPIVPVDVHNPKLIQRRLLLAVFCQKKDATGISKDLYRSRRPDGDMFKIASVDQSGVGCYPPDWIMLKPRINTT